MNNKCFCGRLHNFHYKWSIQVGLAVCQQCAGWGRYWKLEDVRCIIESALCNYCLTTGLAAIPLEEFYNEM